MRGHLSPDLADSQVANLLGVETIMTAVSLRIGASVFYRKRRNLRHDRIGAVVRASSWLPKKLTGSRSRAGNQFARDPVAADTPMPPAFRSQSPCRSQPGVLMARPLALA